MSDYEMEPRWPNGPQDLPIDAKAAPHGILAQTIHGYQQLWLYPSGAWLNGHTEIQRFKIISWTRLVAEADLRARLDAVRKLADETKHKTTDHLGNVTGYLIFADDLNAVLDRPAAEGDNE